MINLAQRRQSIEEEDDETMISDDASERERTSKSSEGTDGSDNECARSQPVWEYSLSTPRLLVPRSQRLALPFAPPWPFVGALSWGRSCSRMGAKISRVKRVTALATHHSTRWFSIARQPYLQ